MRNLQSIQVWPLMFLGACSSNAEKAPDVAASARAPAPSASSLESAHAEPAHVALGPDTVIRLERSSCYGECPHYSLELLADGRVNYVGEDHVAVVGQRTRMILPEEVAFVLRVSRYVEFDQLDPDCSERVSDVSTTTISIRTNGQTRTVVNRWSLGISMVFDDVDLRVPEKTHLWLDYLAQTIDRVALDPAWIRAPSPSAPPATGG